MVLSTPLTNYKFSFSKYSGSGNDFILIDNRNLEFPVDDHPYIARLCHRHYGIGADGVILLQPSQRADFAFRIFNSDGKEAEMCGNGVRCFAKFVQNLGFAKQTFTLETMKSTLFVAFIDSKVAVQMGPATQMQWNIPLSLQARTVTAHFLDTGVPHTIIFVEDLESIDVDLLGREIRFHSHFHPKGTNVNFVSIQNPHELSIRTYERGVEAETLACGTGATAAALAAAFLHHLPSPISIKTYSQECLTITFTKKENSFQEITLIGDAHFIFHGSLNGGNISCK